MQYDNTYKLKKNNKTLINNGEIIIFPNDKTWLPVLKGFDYDNSSITNDYFDGKRADKK